MENIATLAGASPQRLTELRRTAAAFPTDSQRHDIDFHFHTVSARAARRLGLTPAERPCGILLSD